MRFILAFVLLFVTACGNHYNRPRRLYIHEFINTTDQVEELVVGAKDTINYSLGYNLLNLFFGGSKPISVKMVSPEEVGSEVFAHARYLEYHCLIQVRSDLEQMIRSSINPSHPHWVSDSVWKAAAEKILMHELGHCAGFLHTEDSMDLMYKSFNPNWDSSSVDKFTKEFEAANQE